MRLPVVAAALLLALAACGGGAAEDDAPPAGQAVAVDSMGDPAAAPVLPPTGTPWTPEDSARAAIADSIQEARLMHTRQSAMDSYEECLRKAEGADPQQKAILEAACARSRGRSKQ